MRVLFGGERYTAELAWTDLAAELPGWEIVTCPRDQVSKHLDSIDVICPVGARITGAVLETGAFGLVHQFGVGLEKVDVARATDLGVLVSRVPGDAGGNADSVAEIAVLHLLALSRRLDEARAALAAGRWTARPTGASLHGATVVIVDIDEARRAVASLASTSGRDMRRLSCQATNAAMRSAPPPARKK